MKSRLLTVCVSLVFSLPLVAATFTVNDAGDAGDVMAGNGVCATAAGVCTLRAAIHEANGLAGSDTINFAIGSGPQTIELLSPLPITSSMVIDATTQPGSGTGPRILVRSRNSPVVANGFDLEFGSLTVTIQGFAIGGFSESGIKILQPSSNVTIKRCHIGVDIDGLTAIPNGVGILSRVTNTNGGVLTIGDATGGGNVISGNTTFGVDVFDASSGGARVSTFTVQGNRIGVGADGQTAVPNGSSGIRVDGNFDAINVGGSVAARNVISGNGGNGFETRWFFQTTAMSFTHNYVGVAADGVTARPNNGTGAELVAIRFTVASNVFSANAGNGLHCNTGSLASTITSNLVGVAIDGTPLGNGLNGVVLQALTAMTVGGSGAANTIANNTFDGIVVLGNTGIEIAENSIYGNGALGIDLNDNGHSPNDINDSDAGANNTQNFPVISSAARANGVTFINGSLASAPSTNYLVRLYANSTFDGSGYGEGERFVGQVNVTTNAGGNAGFSISSPVPADGEYITATATAANADTSEFSAPVQVQSPGDLRFTTSAVTVAEGTNATLTIERVNGSAGPVTVIWGTTAGTATTSDYGAAGGLLTFASGEVSKTVNVTTTPDVLDEPAETFSVVLSVPTGGSTLLSPSTVTVTITDDDPVPTLSIANATGAEGNAGTTAMNFLVTLSAPSGQPVSVDYVTSNGSATAGSDFAAAAGTLTFAPGELLKSIPVQVIGDTVLELDETFTLTLSSPVNATLAGTAATGTITNDDASPSITIGDVAIAEGDAGTVTAVFPVVLSGPSATAVTVGWSTSAGTATAGVDFTGASGTVTFVPGTTSATIEVLVQGDLLIESNETFFVDLAGPVNATLGDAQGSGTIADDDGTPSLSINDPAVVEGVGATFTVTLAPASALPVTVAYATADLDAVSGSDYSGASGTLTFAAGETAQTLTIATTVDGIAEANEQFTMTLSSPSGATIGDPAGTATILDDDGVPRVTIGNVSAAEGDAGTTTFTFTVDLSHSSADTVGVTWSTADLSAVGGSDFTGAIGTLTFVPGDTTETIAVTVTGDTTIESDESFTVRLDSATNAVITDGEGAGTIVNDDGTVLVSIADVSAPEGSGSLVFAVSLNGAAAEPVTVQWATTDGSASSPADYTAASGSVVFAPGETAKNITVTVTPDALYEPDETLSVTLLGSSHGTILDAQATGTILNDDPVPVVPSITISPASVVEGNAGTAVMTFSVALNAPTVNTVTVNYATADASAGSGADYVPAAGSLTFAPGATSQSISVTVVGDTLVESNETMTVALSGAVNATVTVGAATGTIVDDDSAPVVPAITIGDVAQLEGDSGATLYAFPVTLSAPTTLPVSVAWATSPGTANASDFAPASGSLVFAPAMTSATIFVAAHGDEAVELDETFSVVLSSPANATLARAAAAGTIRNDDRPVPTPPVLRAASVRVVEGDDGERTVTVTLTLSKSSAGSSVRWLTRGETATSGVDFAGNAGRATFGPGATSASIELIVRGDRADEEDETFFVELFGELGLTLVDERVEITIEDDDAPAVPRAIVLAIGSLRGAAGSRFGTEVQMVNPGDVPAAGRMVFRPAATADPARDVTFEYVLNGREQRTFGDLLAERGISGLGTLDVLPSTGGVPRMNVRIFDDGSGRGTTGFTLPVVTPDDALVAGDRAILVAPENPLAMRFNVGVRTLDAGAVLEIAVRSRSGTVRSTASHAYAANWFNQVAAAEFAGLALEAGDYIEVRVAEGSVLLYGATIDNVTNDASVQVIAK